EARVGVALLARDDVPLDLLVDGVERLVAAQVPVEAAAARHGAAAPVVLRHLLGEGADAHGAELDDVVVQEEVVELLEARPHVADVAAALLEPAGGQVVLNAAD